MTSFLNIFLWFRDFHSVMIMDGCDHLFSLQSFRTLPVGHILSGAIWLRFLHFFYFDSKLEARAPFRQGSFSPYDRPHSRSAVTFHESMGFGGIWQECATSS